MDHEGLAEARLQILHAESRARLTDDRVAKKEWERVAENWKARLAELKAEQNGQRGSRPSPKFVRDTTNERTPTDDAA
jgi:hypothetical protein